MNCNYLLLIKSIHSRSHECAYYGSQIITGTDVFTSEVRLYQGLLRLLRKSDYTRDWRVYHGSQDYIRSWCVYYWNQIISGTGVFTKEVRLYQELARLPWKSDYIRSWCVYYLNQIISGTSAFTREVRLHQGLVHLLRKSDYNRDWCVYEVSQIISGVALFLKNLDYIRDWGLDFYMM